MARSILIVDDDEDTAWLFAECLRRRGYAARAVTSADDCLERLANERVDVVITDVMMPGISGLALCDTLRARHPELLAIVVSGRSTRGAALEAIHAGAYDYITKPVNIDVLEIAIARAFDHLELRRVGSHAVPGACKI